MRRALGSLLLLLVACGGGDTDTDIEPVDTGDEDIPDTFLGRTSKPSDVERRGESLRAGLVQVTVETDDTWTLGAYLAGGKLSGTGNFGIELPETPPDAVADLPGGRRGVLYLPVVYDDVNLDEVFQENVDDLVLGYATDRWLAWLEPGSDDLDGWVVIDRTGETWQVYPRTEQAVVSLRGLSAIARVEGIYAGEREAVGVVAVDERRVDGGEASSDWTAFTAAVEETGKFVGTIDGRPPIDAFQFPEGSVRYVRMTPVFFEDLDGDGEQDEDEDLLPSRLCLDGAPVYARFSDTPRTVELARQIERLGWTTGWRLVTGPYGDETELDRAAIQWTRYGDDCVVE